MKSKDNIFRDIKVRPILNKKNGQMSAYFRKSDFPKDMRTSMKNIKSFQIKIGKVTFKDGA